MGILQTTGIGHQVAPLFASVAVALSLAACSTVPPHASKGDTEASKPSSPVTIRVAAVGDIMLGSDFPDDRLPPDKGASLLSDVAPLLRNSDIAFANLEGVLRDGGEPAKRCGSDGRCFVFRSPSSYSSTLRDAGFRVVSLANNHARDFGEEGRSATMAALDKAGILYSGREGEFASWEVKGRRVALIAFAPYAGSNPMLDLPAAAAQVRALSASHDLVVVSFHGGAEGGQHARVPFAFEYYYGEPRGDVVLFSRAMVEAGADLVLGHGPHVPRALELYQGRLIAYSLGNFATYRGINIRGTNGLAPILLADLGPDGRLLRGRIVSARQERPVGTLLDDSHAAALLIRELTLLDFPQTPLRIASDGVIQVMDNRPAAPTLAGPP